MRADLKRKKDIELKDQIAHIETKSLGSELAALLYEAHEIKTYRPPYNRALKKMRFPYGLYIHKGEVNEIRVTSAESNQDCEYRFGSKRTAQSKRNALYKSLIGHGPDGLFFEKAMETHLKTLGADHFNSMLDKIFYRDRPKAKDYSLILPHHIKTKKVIIEVREDFPRSIQILNAEEIEESLDLMEHPEIQSIMRSYMQKHKLKVSL